MRTPNSIAVWFTLLGVLCMPAVTFAQNDTPKPQENAPSTKEGTGTPSENNDSSSADKSESKSKQEESANEKSADKEPETSPADETSTGDEDTKKTEDTSTEEPKPTSDETASTPQETSAAPGEQTPESPSTPAEQTPPETSKAKVVSIESVDLDAPAEPQPTPKSEPDTSRTATMETGEENEKRPKRSLFVLTYNMAVPMGSTRDFVDEFSYQGVGFEYRFHILPELSVGALIAWSTFDQKLRGTWEYDNLTLTGTKVRSLDTMPLCATVHYNAKVGKGKLVPFAGLNLGTYRSVKTSDHGWWYSTTKDWHFGLAPEVGIRFASVPIPFYFSTKFNYIAPTKDSSTLLYMGFNLGISWAR